MRVRLYKEHESYIYDISYKPERLRENLLSILGEFDNLSEIIDNIGFDMFLSTMELVFKVGEFHEEDKRYFDKIMIEYCIAVASDVSTIDGLKKLHNNHVINHIRGINADADNAVKSIITRIERAVIDFDSIVKVFEKINNSSGWDYKDEEFLNSLTQDFIREGVKNHGFFRALVDFVSGRSEQEGDSFYELSRKTRTLIQDLGVSFFGSHRYDELTKRLRIM